MSETLTKFEVWWEKQPLAHQQGLQPIMSAAFKEISKKAWDAALETVDLK